MHIVGGLHHQKRFDWYVHLLRILHDAYPQLHLKAWTAVEINWFEHLTEAAGARDPRGTAGRGAGQHAGRRCRDLSSRRARAASASTRPTPPNGWTCTAPRIELGIRTNCTMLYGHIENDYHRIDHLLRLRELQDETGGFQAFVPLAFHPGEHGADPSAQAVGADRPACAWPCPA